MNQRISLVNPSWARECLKKFKTEDGSTLGSCAEGKLQLIYKVSFWCSSQANKRDHFASLKELTGVDYKEMLFFDNQRNNITDVSKLGVKCLFCPEGISENSWRKGLALFNLKDLP
jgi:magnesium-dependent phosphatase 1